MVVLTAGETTTTGVLAVLANTAVTGRDVATAAERKASEVSPDNSAPARDQLAPAYRPIHSLSTLPLDPGPLLGSGKQFVSSY